MKSRVSSTLACCFRVSGFGIRDSGFGFRTSWLHASPQLSLHEMPPSVTGAAPSRKDHAPRGSTDQNGTGACHERLSDEPGGTIQETSPQPNCGSIVWFTLLCHQTRGVANSNTPTEPHLLYTSLCTGELNAIRWQKCFICSPFHGRACRWAMLGELKPKGPT